MQNKHIGSSFEDFLKEEGRYEEATVQAIKRVLAWQLTEAMKKNHISKVEMAKRMHTSRSQLDRLLDPKNDKVFVGTVQRAAFAIGKRFTFQFEDDENSVPNPA